MTDVKELGGLPDFSVEVPRPGLRGNSPSNKN